MFSYPGRDPEVAIGEQAAEGGDKSALAGMGGGAEDHEKAGHATGGCGASLFAFWKVEFAEAKSWKTWVKQRRHSWWMLCRVV